MSYSFAIAGDARADFHRLDAQLQEELLDELEVLTQKRSILPPSGIETLYTFRRQLGTVTFMVAATLVCNDQSETIWVLGIAHEELP